MSAYPPAADLAIAYNVLQGGVLEGSPLDDQPVTHVICRAGIEPLSLEEADRVDRLAHKSIQAYRRQMWLPRLTELRDRVWSLSNIGDVHGDRTLPAIFTYLPMVDCRFVSFLQDRILGAHPTGDSSIAKMMKGLN